MIRGKMINAAASLNNYQHIGSVEYMLGDAFVLNFQLWDPELKIRFVPPATAIVKVTLNNQDSTTNVKTATFIDPLDLSLNSIAITAADSAQLLDGNLNFSVDLLGDGTKIVNGLIFAALQQIIISTAIST
jgi:hypothetical protein